MNLHVIVGGIPAVQLFLGRSRPQHRTVKHTAVLKAIRQSADVNAAAFSKGLHRHLYLLVLLDQDGSFRKCKNVLLALAEIHSSVCVCKDKVILMFFPVVFICI